MPIDSVPNPDDFGEARPLTSELRSSALGLPVRRVSENSLCLPGISARGESNDDVKSSRGYNSLQLPVSTSYVTATITSPRNNNGCRGPLPKWARLKRERSVLEINHLHTFDTGGSAATRDGHTFDTGDRPAGRKSLGTDSNPAGRRSLGTDKGSPSRRPLCMFDSNHSMHSVFDSFAWVPSVFMQSWHRKLTDTYSEYNMVNLIGEGQQGAVFVVQHQRTKQQFACKLMSKGDHDRAALVNEIEMLWPLDHPNVIRLYETNEDRESLFLIMELCLGGDLLERIREEGGKICEPLARVFARQLLSALAYCHSSGVVHGDVKPENVLLETEDASCVTVKLADFGIATCMASMDFNRRTDEMRGSLPYMAPELFNTEGPELETMLRSPARDLWGVGVIVYSMLVGSLPYGADPRVIRKARPLEFSGPTWQDISADAIDLIAGLLTVDREARLTARQALSHKWICGTTSTPSASSTQPSGSASNAAPALADTWVGSLHEVAVEVLGQLRRWRSLKKLQRIAIAALARQVEPGHPRRRFAERIYHMLTGGAADVLWCTALADLLSAALQGRSLPLAPKPPPLPRNTPARPQRPADRRDAVLARSRLNSGDASEAKATGPAPVSYQEVEGRALREEIVYLAEALDATKDGVVDYTLLVAAMLTQDMLVDESRISEAFTLFDVRRCGGISGEDLQRVLGLASMSKKLSKMITAYDKNGDGVLDMNEFKGMITSATLVRGQ
eukprot:TRINITY_DN72420_c0_g1_i1.p1 TRINITY_DN72420_c0_g1~~TRINITY_DN72420_c0_g1_i1.p1  ORF type:complete len:734 (-),score=115.41 TRINITY_DN72420_c0_g1_i1:62-2263(-)